jgi:hypothetical protein
MTVGEGVFVALDSRWRDRKGFRSPFKRVPSARGEEGRKSHFRSGVAQR